MPTGGVRYPSSMLVRKTMPRWTGSMPKASPSGTISGTSSKGDRREKKLPFGGEERGACFRPIEAAPRAGEPRRETNAPDRDQADHQQPGQYSSEEHLIDGDLRHDAVEHERQARRQQAAQRSSSGKEAERPLLGIARARE